LKEIGNRWKTTSTIKILMNRSDPIFETLCNKKSNPGFEILSWYVLVRWWYMYVYNMYICISYMYISMLLESKCRLLRNWARFSQKNWVWVKLGRSVIETFFTSRANEPAQVWLSSNLELRHNLVFKNRALTPNKGSLCVRLFRVP
jgi:hypothetical protein